MIEEIIRSSLHDEEDGNTDPRIKPALTALLYDQAALFDAEKGDHNERYDIRSGFPNRRLFIEWYQRAAVRTLGYIEETFEPVDCIDDDPTIAAFLTDPPGSVESMEDKQSRAYRAHVESHALLPACNKAYRDLRKGAGEYINRDEYARSGTESPMRDLDPSKQKYIAMRPGFQTLDEQQQSALEYLWGGFHTYEQLLDWLHSLNAPSNGEIHEEIASFVLSDEDAMDHLLYDPDTDEARVFREIMACTELLPAFIEGVRSIDTGELAQTTSTKSGTYRMEGGKS